MIYALFRFSLFLAFILFIISGHVFVAVALSSMQIQQGDSLWDSLFHEPLLSLIVMTVFLVYLLMMLLVRARNNIAWFTKARSTSVIAIYSRFIVAYFILFLFFDSCLRFLFALLPSGRIGTELSALTEQQATHEALPFLDWSNVVIPHLFVNMIFCWLFFTLTWAVCPGIFTGNIFIPRKADTAFSTQPEPA